MADVVEVFFLYERRFQLTAALIEICTYVWKVFKTARIHHYTYIDHKDWTQDSLQALQDHYLVIDSEPMRHSFSLGKALNHQL